MIVELLAKSQEKLSEWKSTNCSGITERVTRAFVEFWRGVFTGLPALLGATSRQHTFKYNGRRLPSCPEKRMV